MLTLGKLAQSVDVSVETVRYYQRIGLLDKPARPAGSIRAYDDGHVRRLRLIRTAQSFGFTLGEIAQLLAESGEKQCGKAHRLAESKLADVRRKLDALRQAERTLEALVASCAQGPVAGVCPLVSAFESAL